MQSGHFQVSKSESVWIFNALLYLFNSYHKIYLKVMTRPSLTEIDFFQFVVIFSTTACYFMFNIIEYSMGHPEKGTKYFGIRHQLHKQVIKFGYLLFFSVFAIEKIPKLSLVLTTWFSRKVPFDYSISPTKSL